MKIEIEIEISADGTYGSRLVQRKMMLEASRLPSETSTTAADIIRQAITEAEEKEERPQTSPKISTLPGEEPAF